MQTDIEKYTTFNFDSPIKFGINQINNLKIPRVILTVQEKNKVHGGVIEDTFTFYCSRDRFRTNIKHIIIICSKDNGKILDHTLDILKQYRINESYDILLVDDRSVSNDILELSDKYETSYIKISNDNDIFSYSAINNIAACYAKHHNKELILFYNNDLWPSSESTIDNLIKKHYDHKSDISGCRLIYPTQEEYEQLGKPNHLLSTHLDKIYGSIQHGGIHFILRNGTFLDSNRKYYGDHVVLAPTHLWRFYDKDTKLAKTDALCYAVTGAIQIIKTETFISLNGFDDGLCTAFQDIDLCLKAVEKNLSVNYFGSECMAHAESLTQAIEQNNYQKTITSDNVWWDIKWGTKLPYLLGFQFYE